MADVFGTNETPNRNGCSETYNDYLNRAIAACEGGDLVLGMHLYLAAYEKAVVEPTIPDGMALTGLREAWKLACELKERSMAEYVFEKLEPYLTGEEIAICAQKLQNLALDRLEQYGFSRDELEDMAQMITQDFANDGSVLKVESIAIPHVGTLGSSASTEDGAKSKASDEKATAPSISPAAYAPEAPIAPVANAEPQQPSSNDQDAADKPTKAKGEPSHVGMAQAPADDFNPYDYYRDYSIGKSYHAATNEGAGAHVFTRDLDRIEAAKKAQAESADTQQAVPPEQRAQTPDTQVPEVSATQPEAPADAPETQNDLSAIAASITAIVAEAISDESASEQHKTAQEILVPQHSATQPQQAEPQQAAGVLDPNALTYRNLLGYDEAISVMRDYGIGLQNDRNFIGFVNMLNERHGLDRAPALDTFLFRAATIEDATRFAEATIGEIGLPALRMSMEEGIQGMPLLCVTTQGNNRPRMNHAHNRFEAPAILVLDDLDDWTMPTVPEGVDGMNGFVMANISRGAREAVNMIRSAVEDPDVFVIATATLSGEPDPFFYDILEPLTVLDIGLPNEKERADIWTEIARDHPSMRTVNRANLVKYSEGLSRYDIYIAAREAIEEAYKIGLIQRGYVPVTPHNIFEKIAAYQPLDSEFYTALEEEVIRSFQSELEHLEDLIEGASD